jgi:DNA-binding response OmpR family regulator
MTQPIGRSVLVLENCQEQQTVLRFHLEGMGFVVHEGKLLSADPHLVAAHNYDLAILCSDNSIVEVAKVSRNIRALTPMPVICLLNSHDPIGEDLALDAGASDFIHTPVRPRVLALRIHQQLGPDPSSALPSAKTIEWGPLELDLSNHRFQVGGRDVTLTPAEFLFMKLLMASPRQIFSRDQIIDAIGSFRGFGSDHIVDNHASRIRQKVRSAGGPEVICVVRSVGFRLANGAPASEASEQT